MYVLYITEITVIMKAKPDFFLLFLVSPPTLFASVNALNGNILQIKEELNANRKRRTSQLQIDRFVEAMEEFLMEAEPIVEDLNAMTKDIEERLKELILYYGEDPNTIKSEEFFGIISTFSNSFEVSSKPD